MFGYVRPVREELKCKDFDRYRATYCGLCGTLRQRYGWIAPMFLNFDFTFLALLLCKGETQFPVCRGRCHANPFLKKTMCASNEALIAAADESVILTYWQLKDKVQDSSVWKGIPYRMLCLLLSPAYRKAARQRQAFDLLVQKQLQSLAQLEGENCQSLDRAADTFAVLLQGAAIPREDVGEERAMKELLYHLGRWIYLIDALDDFKQDQKEGNYNPIQQRFSGEPHQEQMAVTLNHSLNLMCSAAQLIDFGCRWAIIENILYLGLPLVQKAVLDGTYQQLKKQKIWRSNL